ncbi:MAG TPA: hypothetical protein VLA33_01230 [Gemmatimonadota bacterium]|nr:hypothetical protein [Gemmatimonadota bacterium]
MRSRTLLLIAVSVAITPLVTTDAIGQAVASEAGAAALVTQQDLVWVEIIPGVDVQGEFTNPYPGEQGAVMRSGDYWYVPAGMAHSNECVSDEACVI